MRSIKASSQEKGSVPVEAVGSFPSPYNLPNVLAPYNRGSAISIPLPEPAALLVSVATNEKPFYWVSV